MGQQYDWQTNDDKITQIIGEVRDKVSPATQSIYERSGALDTMTPEEAPATPENFNRSIERASRLEPDPARRNYILNLRVGPSNPQENLGGEVGVPPTLTTTAVKEKLPETMLRENEVIPTPIVSTQPGKKPQAGLFTKQGVLKTPLGEATIKEEGKPSPEGINSMGAIVVKKLMNGEEISPGEEALALAALKVNTAKMAQDRLKKNYDYLLADEPTQNQMQNDLSDRIAQDTLNLMRGRGRQNTGQPGKANSPGPAAAPGTKPKIISIKKIQ